MTTIQDVVDYVNAWRANNGVANDAVLTNAQLIQLAQDTQGKISELGFKSASAPSANILPYSGKIEPSAFSEGMWMFAAAASNSSNGDLIYISDLEAGQLLNSDSFRNAVKNAAGDVTLGNAILDGAYDANGVRSPTGVGGVLSVNDYVSREAMLANAKGNVTPLEVFGRADSVYAQTELRTLISDTAVDSIWGVPRAQLDGLRARMEVLVSSFKNLYMNIYSANSRSIYGSTSTNDCLHPGTEG